MNFEAITSFSQIKTPDDGSKTLIVIDIDDTTMVYDKITQKWWASRFDHHFKSHGNSDLAEDQSLEEWVQHIHQCIPKHTDKDGFQEFMARADAAHCHVIFLTARSEVLSEITRAHLTHLELGHISVYYSFRASKGLVLRALLAGELRARSFESVLFVDDKEKNLADVRQAMQEDGVDTKLFRFDFDESTINAQENY